MYGNHPQNLARSMVLEPVPKNTCVCVHMYAYLHIYLYAEACVLSVYHIIETNK